MHFVIYFGILRFMKTRLFKYFFIFLYLCGVLSAGEIRIAVAANVSYAIEELKTSFSTQHPDIKVNVVLGSSGKLTAQIKNGAPYGLFMSANMKYPQALYEEGLALEKPHVYTKGALACLSVKKQDFSQGVRLLKDKAIQKISIANPKTAPYGKASVEAIKNAGIYDEVKAKLVYAESISQAVSYTLIATQVGLIAKSSLFSSKMIQYKEGTHWFSVNSELYTPIEQGIVRLKYAKGKPEYKAFYDFILSPSAQSIFKKYGYLNK